MYLSCSWTLSLWSWVVGVKPILAFFIGCLTALPGVEGDRIRFVWIVWCSGVLGSSFWCGVFGGVCCCGVLGGCTWVLQDFQHIAAFKRVVVDIKFVESSCLIFRPLLLWQLVCPVEKHIICQGHRKQFADGQAEFDVNDETGNNSRTKRAAKFWI